ncbi:MAG: phospholipase D family protein [Rickettsiales bacterium]
MKLITEQKQLVKTFYDLIDKYSNISFAVAWASDNDVLEKLFKNRQKIKKSTIGTHFYQTHPDVIKKFIDSKQVKFESQTSGVFHPKIYIFWDENNWELLIGSANLTKAALFNKNAEAMMLISRKNADDRIKKQTLSVMKGYWKNAKTVEEEYYDKYRNIWEMKQGMLGKLSENYGDGNATHASMDSVVMSMLWKDYKDYIDKVQYKREYSMRLSFLSEIKDKFNKNKHFKDIGESWRCKIAGLPYKGDGTSYGCFGGMRGAGGFMSEIKNNNDYISDALDRIPLKGAVTKEDYDNYLELFKKVFGAKSDTKIGTATRLISMKRPDQFICLNGKNQKELCKDFGIKKTNMNYDRYWSEIVERVRDTCWWNTKPPKDKEEKDLWDNRVAMLDMFFYQE